MVKIHHHQTSLQDSLIALDLPRILPVLVLVGGAGGIDPLDMRRLEQVFRDRLVPAIEALGAAVVDGGTDAGIMRLIGQARHGRGADFPLVGVAAEGTVILPEKLTENRDAAYPEPHHSHLLLVPGSQWGDESPWIAAVATAIAQGCPSLTLVINGGEVTWRDVECSIQAQRPLIILAGSGRTADKIAQALRGHPSDPRAVDLLPRGQFHLCDLHQIEQELLPLLHNLFQAA